MSYRRHAVCSRRIAILLIAGSALLFVADRVTAQVGLGSSGPRSYRRTSDWWPQVELIDGSLRNGKWKYARKNAKNLGKTIITEAWNDRELSAILAELALYQAIAEANLDRRGDAIWHWYTALNLDGGIASRDFTPYGNAGRLFIEFPLRKRGEMPPGFKDTADEFTGSTAIPQAPEANMPNLLNNTGANRQGSGNFEVELVVDNRGDLHQPVVISRHLHPIVIYASLEWLHNMPAFEPARIGERAVSTLYPLIVEFHVSSYRGHLTIERPPPIPLPEP